MRTVQSLLTLRSWKVIPVATSTVAASLLDNGRTANSVFKIPIPCDSEIVCSISLDSALAAEIREADLIIWDEIVMCVRYCIEVVDRTLRAIMNDPALVFGGKYVLRSGNCRQILPVVPNASRGIILNMCLKSSCIFPELRIIHFTENMRLKALKEDPNAKLAALEYLEYLLRIGEGWQDQDQNSYIHLLVSVTVVQSPGKLIDSLFPNLSMIYCDTKWLTSRAILAPTKSWLKVLNDLIIKRFSGSYFTFLSANSVVSENPEDQKSTELKYLQKLLNSIEAVSSLSDRAVRLKKGFMVMLLCNVRLKCGHVTGTRYIVQNMTKKFLFLRVVSGTAKRSSLVLQWMNCIPGLVEFPIPRFRCAILSG